MNLLLIDDEPLTVKMLKKNIHWSSLGIDEVYTAYDTICARQIIKSCQIHIILCDIEMPGESGLSFIHWLNESTDCDAVSLLLTCHDEFTYAKEAVSLNIMEYMLKPVPYDILENTIRRAVETYLKEQQKKEQILAGQYWQQYASKIDKEMISSDPTVHEKIFSDISEYVKQHINEEIDRNKIAVSVHMNADYLSKIFKKKTGITISEYIRLEKLNYSKYLLRNTSLNIAEISSQLCFSSQAHFSNSFKKQFGYSPMEYKNSCV